MRCTGARAAAKIRIDVMPIHSDFNCAFPSSHQNAIFGDFITLHHQGRIKRMKRRRLLQFGVLAALVTKLKHMFSCGYSYTQPHTKCADVSILLKHIQLNNEKRDLVMKILVTDMNIIEKIQ